jgi:hypothetical protein
MPVLRRGRVVRFPRERLLAWLARHEPRSARRLAQTQHKPPAASRNSRTLRQCPSNR